MATRVQFSFHGRNFGTLSAAKHAAQKYADLNGVTAIVQRTTVHTQRGGPDYSTFSTFEFAPKVNGTRGRSNPTAANPSDSVLKGAKILGTVRNSRGVVTGVRVQLRPGAKAGGAGVRSNPVKAYRTQAAAEKAHAKLISQGHYDAGVIYDAYTRMYKVMWKGEGTGAGRANPNNIAKSSGKYATYAAAEKAAKRVKAAYTRAWAAYDVGKKHYVVMKEITHPANRKNPFEPGLSRKWYAAGKRARKSGKYADMYDAWEMGRAKPTGGAGITAKESFFQGWLGSDGGR